MRERKRLIVDVSKRAYPCPVCGGRTLKGHSYRATPHAVTVNRYLLPYASSEAAVLYNCEVLPYRSLFRFTIYFCPRDLLILDSPIAFKAELTQVDEDQILFHQGNMDWIAVAGKGMTFQKVLWMLIARYRDRLAKVDWFKLVFDELDERALKLFRNKHALFNSVVNAALQGPDGEESAQSMLLLDRVLDGGLFGILGSKPFAKRVLGALMFDYKMAHYALKIARDNDVPLRLDGEDLLQTISKLLDKLANIGLREKKTVGRLMMTALKRIRFASSALEVWKLKMLALFCAELLIAAGDYDYSDPDVMARLVYQNNEAIKYLDLLLRKELAIDDGLLNRRERIEAELVRALNHSDAYFLHGHSARAIQKAIRIGERLRELSGRYLGIELY